MIVLPVDEVAHDQPAVEVDVVEVAVHPAEPQTPVLVHRGQQVLDVGRVPDVVLIDERDPVALRHPDREVACRGLAAVRRRADDADERVLGGEPLGDRPALIGRPVVDHDELIRQDGLLDDAAQGLLDPGLAVVDGHDADDGRPIRCHARHLRKRSGPLGYG